MALSFWGAEPAVGSPWLAGQEPPRQDLRVGVTPAPNRGGLDLVRRKAAERRSQRINKPLGISMALMKKERVHPAQSLHNLPQRTHFSVSVRRLTSSVTIQSRWRTWLLISATPYFVGLLCAPCRVRGWCQTNRRAEPGLRPRARSPTVVCAPVFPLLGRRVPWCPSGFEQPPRCAQCIELLGFLCPVTEASG